MARTQSTVLCGCGDATLERRELLSSAGASSVPAAVGSIQSGPTGNLFHANGINGLKLQKAFVNQMNDRLTTAQNATHRLFEAFQVFSQGYADLVSPPPAGGSSGTSPTLESLLADLQREVGSAVSTTEIVNNQVSPSVAKAPKFSQRSLNALLPFSLLQISQMADTLVPLPPIPTATQAMNTAYNAVLNAEAEYSLHPNLFQKPSDYYLNTTVFFPITLDGNPATSTVGYFVRGPGGALLPGAIVHPHLTVQ
jgi:hypothetical protein